MIVVQSSLPSSHGHAAHRALRGLENTTPSPFSPSKLKGGSDLITRIPPARIAPHRKPCQPAAVHLKVRVRKRATYTEKYTYIARRVVPHNHHVDLPPGSGCSSAQAWSRWPSACPCLAAGALQGRAEALSCLAGARLSVAQARRCHGGYFRSLLALPLRRCGPGHHGDWRRALAATAATTCGDGLRRSRSRPAGTWTAAVQQ